MAGLNKGKIRVGGPNHVSYGTQSPALDTPTLIWTDGDVRYPVGLGVNSIDRRTVKWLCIQAGQPGLWVRVVTQAVPAIVVPMVYAPDAFSLYGVDVYGAPATADWRTLGEAPGTVRNCFPIEDWISADAPLVLRVSAYVDLSAAGAAHPVAFRVVKQTGATVGPGTATGTMSSTATGLQNIISAEIDDVVPGVDSLALVMNAPGTIAPWTISMGLNLTVYETSVFQE